MPFNRLWARSAQSVKWPIRDRYPTKALHSKQKTVKKSGEKRDQKPYLQGHGHHLFSPKPKRHTSTPLRTKKQQKQYLPRPPTPTNITVDVVTIWYPPPIPSASTRLYLPNLREGARRARSKKQCQTYEKHKRSLLLSSKTQKTTQIGSPTSPASFSNKTANGRSPRGQHQILNR